MSTSKVFSELNSAVTGALIGPLAHVSGRPDDVVMSLLGIARSIASIAGEDFYAMLAIQFSVGGVGVDDAIAKIRSVYARIESAHEAEGRRILGGMA